MAYLYQLKSGRWRAQIELRGTRDSLTFATKTAAKAWAAKREAEILDGTASRWPAHTLGDAIDKYERQVTPGKGAAKFERVAFGLMRREYAELLSRPLHAITTADLAEWRDDRLRHVSGSTVQRYVALLRNVWTIASREWGWCPEPTPWRALKMPTSNPPRDRIIHWTEARAILRRLNYVTGMAPITKMQQAAYAFLLSLRTSMRAGEVLSLTGASIDGQVVKLDHHKTKHVTGRARFVPVSKQASRLLQVLAKDGLLFDLRGPSLDALFRKARAMAGLEGFTFHDARATALTHLSRRVDVLTLARISGHRDLRMLMVYYREADRSIADRL